MAFDFKSFRKTVAPSTGAELLSTTLPKTTRYPRFCASALNGPMNPPFDPKGTKPAAKRANATPAAKLMRFNLTLPPLPLRANPLRPRPDPRAPAPPPAVLRQPPRTRFRIRRGCPSRLPPLHPIRCLVHSRIQGSWPWQPPLFTIFRITGCQKYVVRLSYSLRKTGLWSRGRGWTAADSPQRKNTPWGLWL